MSLQPPRNLMPRGSKTVPAGRAPPQPPAAPHSPVSASTCTVRRCLQPPGSPANLACSPANRLLPFVAAAWVSPLPSQPPPRPLPAARVRSAALPPPGTHRRRLLLLLRLLLLGSGLQRTEPEAAPPSPAPPAPPASPPGPAGGAAWTPPALDPAPGVPASALGGSAHRPLGRAGMPVSAGGWGRLGRLGRGVCPPGLGLRGEVLANAPPLPVLWAPNFVLLPCFAPSGDHGRFEEQDAWELSTLIKRKREQ